MADAGDLKVRAMVRRRNLGWSVLWRILASLAIFNPVFSITHWALLSWDSMPGVVVIVLALVAAVVLYMLSLARDFPGVTLATAIVIAVILAGMAMQGWIDLFSFRFWMWAAPIFAGILFAAGPVFATVRRREAGIVASDETPD
jgi:hypothetical protein